MGLPMDRCLRGGIAAARAKRLDEARELLKHAVEVEPENPFAWFWLAVVAPSGEAAISHLRRVLALDPSHVAAREALAKLLFAQADRLRTAADRLSREAAALAPQATVPETPTTASSIGSQNPPESVAAECTSTNTSAQTDAAASGSTDRGSCSSAVVPSRTVMVVDDSPTIRKILSLTLEDAGYSVIAEADGESALASLIDVVPDVILLDIAMPGIDGYETCTRIRSDARTARLPIIMLSGKDALFDKVKGHMAGATEYLTKPFAAATVLAAVAGACAEAA